MTLPASGGVVCKIPIDIMRGAHEMGHKLRSYKMDDDIYIIEKACENYRCRSCGAKMISVNYVNTMCVQVFVPHGKDCEFVDGNPAERTVDVTCETCKYYNNGLECLFDGGEVNGSTALM